MDLFERRWQRYLDRGLIPLRNASTSETWRYAWEPVLLLLHEINPDFVQYPYNPDSRRIDTMIPVWALAVIWTIELEEGMLTVELMEDMLEELSNIGDDPILQIEAAMRALPNIRDEEVKQRLVEWSERTAKCLIQKNNRNSR